MERLISGNRYQGEADCTGGYPRGNHVSSVNYQCAIIFLASEGLLSDACAKADGTE